MPPVADLLFYSDWLTPRSFCSTSTVNRLATALATVTLTATVPGPASYDPLDLDTLPRLVRPVVSPQLGDVVSQLP